MPTFWQIFIDESGDFLDSSATVVVAGLLLQTRLQKEHRQGFIEALARAFPGEPFPPKAFSPHRPKGAQKQQQEALVQLGEAFSKGLGPDGAFVVASAESQQAHLASPASGKLSAAEAGQRYRDLAMPLYERVLALLRKDGAQQQHVEVHVLGPTFPQEDGRRWSYTLTMLRADLRDAQQLTHRTASTLSGAESVVFEAFPPCSWNPQMHPALVLADFAANRLQKTLRGRPAWPGAHASFHTRMGLSLIAPACGWPAARMPSLAASGAPQQVLRQAFLHGAPAPPWLPQTFPPWAREQASGWLSLLSRTP